MATKYLVKLFPGAGQHWSDTLGGSDNTTLPTLYDDVVLDFSLCSNTFPYPTLYLYPTDFPSGCRDITCYIPENFTGYISFQTYGAFTCRNYLVNGSMAKNSHLLIDEEYAQFVTIYQTSGATVNFENCSFRKVHIYGGVFNAPTNKCNIDLGQNKGFTGFGLVKPFIIHQASGVVSVDYCSIANCHAQGGADFYANNSDDAGGNTGWIFLNEGESEETVKGITPAINAETLFDSLIDGLSEEVFVSDFFDSLHTEQPEGISAQDFFDNLMGTLTEEVGAVGLFEATLIPLGLGEEISANTEFLAYDALAVIVDENIELADSHNLAWLDSILETFDLGDSQGVGWLKELIETLFVYDEVRHGWAVTAESSLILTDAIETILGIIVDEWLTFIDIQSNNWNGREIITEDVTLYDIAGFAKIYADSLTDEINIADVSTYQLTITVLEYLGFAELANAMRASAAAISDSLDIADNSALAFPQSVESILDVVDLSTVAVQFLHSVQSDFNLADVSSLIKRFTDTVSDPLIFVDTITSRANLYSLIYDTLRLNVLVDLEGEFYECYVLNTPKFHPSMYSGFDFNSFCVFENRAFGANDTGIYELTGDTDAGSTIHTGIIFSNTNFDLPNQKRFRRGYLDISGTSPKMMIETEGGQRQAYEIDEQGKFVASHELKSKSWILSVADFETLSSMKLIPIILTK